MQDNTFSSGKFSLKKECVYEIFGQKRDAIVITKSLINHFRVFYHVYPVFNSLKEWKFTLLHLESIIAWSLCNPDSATYYKFDVTMTSTTITEIHTTAPKTKQICTKAQETYWMKKK